MRGFGSVFLPKIRKRKKREGGRGNGNIREEKGKSNRVRGKESEKVVVWS